MSEYVDRPSPTVDGVAVLAEANNGWQVVDRCFHPPGYCIVCGDWDRARFVDFQTRIKAASGQPGPVDPHAYICDLCIDQAHALLHDDGFTEDPDAQDELAKLREAIEVLSEPKAA